ncbi:peptidylprolyl isomerase [Staphylothermus hellenicus]|uniref:Peptidyl-prolyl cis-trans isomerase n=1 Tax=Staphylothermus hellenicus (strain DSM 12710 / JCM 10830 / BK20S6-10-b1 / P8) TaxID=591019 RepID=D7DA17_STAHD|nr:peptidylprolyl isomerase [Staphylothermus hellenicus]ADI32613.1 peptidylprolyl isomerase FKBP-type [Staphylothermus hellenicus DSM 12710]
MGFNEGDFVLVEYTVRVKETGNIVDTTDEALAKKENIYESGRIYGPALIVIGKGWINKVVEDTIKEMNIGEEKTVEVPPEKAFGQRDPSKVRIFSMREFRRRNIKVRVGDVIDFGGVKGIVKSISGGRVVVDFNHPLAGKTLIYKVKVVGELEDLVEKIRALAVRYLQIPGEELDVKYVSEEKKVIISIPTKYITRKDLQYAKVSLATSIYEFFKEDVDEVVFQEEFKFKKAEKKGEAEEKKEEMGAEKEKAEESSSQETGEQGSP